MLSYISVLHQTTTSGLTVFDSPKLSYISVLHQTTTRPTRRNMWRWLSYISVLHQTTTIRALHASITCCLISLFYIKPQLFRLWQRPTVCCLISLFYIKPQRTPLAKGKSKRCLISLFYIKPQLASWIYITSWSCLISLFYIKPQPSFLFILHYSVVLYLCSTSNHNAIRGFSLIRELSYISVLHQTTTLLVTGGCLSQLSYISVLHQTTTFTFVLPNEKSCLISLFYIKPQRGVGTLHPFLVVLYLCSTSNHNI